MFFPERITGIKPGDRVLEVGPGGLPNERADVFLELKLDDNMMAAQRGHADALKTDKPVIFYDGKTFPFEDQEFDYVICSHVFEHVPDPISFAKELFRVAKAGYVEFPTIYYEYLYNYDVHLNIMSKQGEDLLYFKKNDLPFNDFAPVQAFFRHTQEQGYTSLVESLIPSMIEGFEWLKPFRLLQAKKLVDVMPDRPPLAPFSYVLPPPLWRKMAGRVKKELKRYIKTEEKLSLADYLKKPLPHQSVLTQMFGKNSEMVIFDVGSCEGEDSIRYHNLFPKAHIFAFEPLPSNQGLILQHIKQYKANNITLVKEALSDSIGEAEFYVSSGRPEGTTVNDSWDYGNKSSSLLPPDKTTEVHSWLKFKDKVAVQTNTIEAFCESKSIGEIDYIHMDIQGAELVALKGAREYLKKIKSIWLEVENTPLYKNQPLKKDIEAFMLAQGFRKVMDTVDEIAGDQFYVNEVYFPNLQKDLAGDDADKGLIRSSKKIAKKLAQIISPRNSLMRLHTGQIFIVPENMAWAFNKGRYYEKNVEHWLMRIAELIPELVFFDIGANIGYYSLVIGKLGGQVYSFEPSKSTRLRLSLNLRLNSMKNVKTFKHALSDAAGSAKLNIYSSNGNNSLFERQIPPNHSLRLLGTEIIELITLDVLMEQSDIPFPNLIKIDVEGGELNVLKGALKTIGKGLPIILFEYSEGTARDAGFDRENLLEILRPFDYVFYGLAESSEDLTPYKIDDTDNKLVIDNIIAIPNQSDIAQAINSIYPLLDAAR